MSRCAVKINLAGKHDDTRERRRLGLKRTPNRIRPRPLPKINLWFEFRVKTLSRENM